MKRFLIMILEALISALDPEGARVKIRRCDCGAIPDLHLDPDVYRLECPGCGWFIAHHEGVQAAADYWNSSFYGKGKTAYIVGFKVIENKKGTE